MNLFSRFKNLTKPEPKRTAVVKAPYANGTIKIEFPNGKQSIIEGEGFSTNDTVIVQGDRAVGGAPTLTTHNVDV